MFLLSRITRYSCSVFFNYSFENKFIFIIFANIILIFFYFQLASKGARCDYALFVGASNDNVSTLHELSSQAAALKMYLNETFTTLTLKDTTIWEKVIYYHNRILLMNINQIIPSAN